MPAKTRHITAKFEEFGLELKGNGGIEQYRMYGETA
jgi:hypothetical protein